MQGASKSSGMKTFRFLYEELSFLWDFGHVLEVLRTIEEEPVFRPLLEIFLESKFTKAVFSCFSKKQRLQFIDTVAEIGASEHTRKVI